MLRSALSLALALKQPTFSKSRSILVNISKAQVATACVKNASNQSSGRPFQIASLDHLVLTVRDLDKTVDFYTKVLGMEVTTFKGGRKALNYGVQKINLHEYGKEFEPKSHIPTPGSADLCFLTTSVLDDVLEHLQRLNISIVEGPVERTGAVGSIRSIYIRDPDGNLIEISNYINRVDRL
uniref:Glyoxalase domain-containing protein 5 n=1 Tax=Biomphalaria glabrata TaxID=6526 RepID=A0A2C9JHS0_BIOGL